METKFNYIRETRPTQEMCKVLTDSFLQNPMFGQDIFKGSYHRLYALMRLCLLYYFRFGMVYYLRDSNNQVAALSLWNAPGTKPLDIGALLTHGFIIATIRSISTIGITRLKRTLYASAINEKHHVKTPHYYMFMLASAQKGAGRILLNNCRETFKGHALYWESSAPKDNHAYYKSFGATMIGEEYIFGLSNAYFIWEQ